MSGEPMDTSTNSLSKTELPSFVEMLNAPQKNMIRGLWNDENLSIENKIDSINLISNKMPLEARREYRKWRFLMDRSRMPDFYDSQNEEIKMIIAGMFKESTDLEDFARTIMSMKSSLNNPDAFDKWMKNEEIEFKEPSIQEDMKKESTSQSFDKWMNSEEVEFKEFPIQEAMKKRSISQSIAKTTTDPTQNNPSVKPIASEVNEDPNICDAIAIDIGTSKCRISICKDKYIQIVEHEANRSVPSYVALSEQGEWLVGRMAENYAVCLQNVIYDIRWLLGKKNSEINRVQDKKRYFFKRSENLPDDATATFDMIDQDKENPPKILNAEEIFAKLLEPLFATAYKNLQNPTTIAITVPIKSEQDYKNLVEDCVKRVVNNIINPMPFPTTKQDQLEGQPEIKRSKSDHHESLQKSENQAKLQDKSDKRAPWDSIKIELIDEPIAVAAAYAPRLNIHPKGDVALVFCMGAGCLQVAAYFIQQKANWTDLTITRVPKIEPIVENFAGDNIDRLIFEEMMKKLTDQNGGQTPNLSERAKRRLKIACEKMKCALSFAPHTRIDVDSLYRNGDEDCDLVEVIQKDEIKGYYNEEVDKIIKKVGEVYKDLKPKFILLAGGSTRLPVITEYLNENFQGSTICNFLNVDEVAATGAAAIISKTVTVAEKSIGYERVIEIIQEQEKEEEERRNPPPTPTPDTDAEVPPSNTEVPAQDINATPAPAQDTDEASVQDVDVDVDGELPAQNEVVPAPANDIPISRTPNKIHVEGDKLPEIVIKDHQYNPEKESIIQDPHASQDNRSEHPNISYSQPKQPQSVSLTGSCSSDSQDKRYRSGKLVPDVIDDTQNKEAKESENIQRNSSPQELNENVSTNDQSEQQSAITNTPILEDAKPPYPDGHSKEHCNERTPPNLEKTPESSGSNDDQNMPSLPSSGVHTLPETEGADRMESEIQEQHGQPSSRNTVEMQHNEGLSDRFDNSAQSQSFKNNPYNEPQSPTTCLSLNSSEIGHNSQGQSPMPSASAVENKKADRKHTNSISSNPMDTGKQSQQNQNNSAVPTSSKSKNNSSGNADQCMRDDQSVKYYEWKRSDKGEVFIHLNLSELKCGLNSYLIYPAELEGVCNLKMITPPIPRENKILPHPTTSGTFEKVKKVQVSLDLKASGNYACRIALIGVNIHNSEIKRHIYVPYDEPLDFWRKSLIHLELK